MQKQIEAAVPKYDEKRVLGSVSSSCVEGKEKLCTVHTGQPDDVIFLQYTGGTTGVSKGAMLTNKNIISNALAFKAWCQPCLDKAPNSYCLSPLPLYHIFAFSVNALSLFAMGWTNILIMNPREP